MDEFELIRRFFVRQGDDESVSIGIGDDGAVMTPTDGRSLVSVIDTLVEGVHWPAGLPPRDVGFRAVTVNVSDIAAMGGRPRWMTLALTLSAADATWLAEFAAGLFEAAAEYGVSLVGGDTTRGAQTVISVQITGDVDPRHVLRRSGARPGERIYVTGTPGDAAGGLSLLESGRKAGDDSRYLVARFARPRVCVRFAASIARFASAAIDVSDGLFADTQRLLDASGAGGHIETTRLPVSKELRRVFGGAESLQLALAGGDDYQLCFTSNPRNEGEIVAAAEQQNARVTCIGAVEKGSGLVCRTEGRAIDFADEGYRHFR